MRCPIPKPPFVLLVLAVSACASAQDRLEEGIELHSQGRLMEAAYKYADAVDKDPDFPEARERFLATADTVLRMGMEAASAMAGDDPVGAAEEYRAMDRLIAKGAEVGAPVDAPTGYGRARRARFDGAIEELMELSREARDREDFGEARDALLRSRDRYDPSSRQRANAVAAEIEVELRWAEADLREGYLQSSFSHAGQALSLREPPDRSVVARAARVRTEALDRGTMGLAVLPLTTRSDVRVAVGQVYELELSDALELDHWRAPPPFVAVADPVVVRLEARRARRGGQPLSARQVARVLDEVGADLGALIEVIEVTRAEEEVRVEERRARHRNGGEATYRVERGRVTLRVVAEAIVVDRNGREVRTIQVAGDDRGSFERGVYDGNPGELRLSRNEARLFDPDVMDEQEAEVRAEALAEVASGLAGLVFREVLRLVP